MSKKMLISAALVFGLLLPSLPASAMPIADGLGSMPIAREGGDLYQSAAFRRGGLHRPRGIGRHPRGIWRHPRGIWRHPRGIIIRHPRPVIHGIIIRHPVRGIRFHRPGF